MLPAASLSNRTTGKRSPPAAAMRRRARSATCLHLRGRGGIRSSEGCAGAAALVGGANRRQRPGAARASTSFASPRLTLMVQVVLLGLSDSERADAVSTLASASYGVSPTADPAQILEELQSGGQTMDILVVEARSGAAARRPGARRPAGPLQPPTCTVTDAHAVLRRTKPSSACKPPPPSRLSWRAPPSSARSRSRAARAPYAPRVRTLRR